MNKEYAPNTDSRKYLLELKTYCNKIKPFVSHFNKLIQSSNKTAHNMVENEIKMLLPQVSQRQRYYDMQLVTFGIDKDMNLIIQFLVFIQPYTQKPLILYQLKTVPVPIFDQNIKAQSYTHLRINKPYIALNSETYISLRQQELRSCKDYL